MFTILRSLFWLTLAYMVIKPGAELPDASAATAQAFSAGTAILADQVAAVPCSDLVCAGGKAVLAGALQPSSAVGNPMHVVPNGNAVPLPRRRPQLG